MAATDPEADEGCFSSILCMLALLLLIILLPAIGGAISAAAGGAGSALGTIGGIIAGSAVPAAVVVATTTVPETENHIFMIETARFLSNNLKQRDYECFDLTLAPHICDPAGYRGQSDLYINSKNRQAAWILRYLQGVLMEDFDEYNSRPYARKSISAIQNLYDLACALENPCTGDNLRVKVAARAVLDYLSAKFAVSSSTLKRFVPFRRQAERKAVLDPVFGGSADFETWRFAMLMGMQNIPPCEQKDNQALCTDLLSDGWIQLVSTAISTYRLPPMLEWMIEVGQVLPGPVPAGMGDSTGCEGYLQRFKHDGEEIYYCSRTFLLAAGGVEVDPALTVLGLDNHNDHGVALSTTLMPHGVGIDRTQFIRFEGDLNEDDPEDDPEDRYENNSPNLCVDRNFACGLNLVIPDAYKDPACHQKVGDWHFIDATKCPLVQAEFYVAAYERSCDCDAGAPNNFGALEVVDARVGSFRAFIDRVLPDNDGPSIQWEYDEENDYRRIGGETVRFHPEDARIIREYNDDLLAEGDVVWADRTGCVAIWYPRIGEGMILSLRDLNNPYTVHLLEPFFADSADEYCDGSGDYQDSYLVER